MIITEIEVAAAIASLIDKSPLSPSVLNGSSYLRLLDTTHTYASANLSESGKINSVPRTLTDYLIEQFNRSSDRENERRGAYPEVMQIGNIRTALAWAFSDAGDSELGVRLTALAAPHLLELSLLEECHRWCQAALDCGMCDQSHLRSVVATGGGRRAVDRRCEKHSTVPDPVRRYGSPWRADADARPSFQR